MGRGRGFNQAVLNDVRAGVAPADKLPPWLRLPRRGGLAELPLRRQAGEPFADTQFPVASVAELSKQAVPDIDSASLPPNPNWKALADLAGQLKGAVLRATRSPGSFPLEAALTSGRSCSSHPIRPSGVVSHDLPVSVAPWSMCVSNSLSGSDRKLDEVPAVGDPPHVA